MASVNKVILVGNLGRDPEVRVNPDGVSIANVSIATTFGWNDRATGARREETEWHRVVFFNRQAEVVGQYLRKGSQIYVEGRLRTRKYMGKDGIERYTTEVVADTMQMLGGRATSDVSSDYDASYPGVAPANNYAGGAGAYSAPARSPMDGGFATQGVPPKAAPAANPYPPASGTSAPAQSAPLSRPDAPKAADTFADMDEDVPF